MNDFGLYLILSLIIPIIILLAIIVTKMIRLKKIPDSRYAPFDYITGHTTIEFQEQKQEKEEQDEHGDDKD